MTPLALALMANLSTLGCVAAATYLVVTGKEGWGWFLFVAVLVHSSVGWTKS